MYAIRSYYANMEQYSKETLEEVSKFSYKDVPERNIRKETLQRFGVKVAVSETDGHTPTAIYFPSYNQKGKVVGYTKQDLTKNKEEKGHCVITSYSIHYTKLYDWWFAPTATVSTPIAMGVTPIGDSNWKPWSRDQQLTYELAVRSYAEAGYDVIGTFEIGCTATALNQIVLYMYEGKGYEWTGAFPKVVPPASTPAGTGGVGVGAWVDRTDVALRVDLAAEDGASLSLSQIATSYNFV